MTPPLPIHIRPLAHRHTTLRQSKNANVTSRSQEAADYNE
jgi:hypothetical protein